MAAALFVLELWLATALWTALVVAWYARHRTIWRLVLALVASFLPLLPWMMGLCLMAAFHSFRPWQSLGFLFALAKFIALPIAMIWIWRRGLRLIPDLNVAQGATWPLGRLAGSTGVAVILAQTTLWMFDSQMREQLIDLRREAQVLAQSVSPQPIPDPENAAPLYYEAMDAMGINYRGTADQPIVINESAAAELKPDDVPEEPGVPDFRTNYWSRVVDQLDGKTVDYDFSNPRLKAFLERHRGVRELLVRAGRIPSCNFGRDFTRLGYDVVLPEIQEMRGIARYLAVDARHAVAVGDGRRAAEDLETICHCSEHVAQESFLVSALVAMAVEVVGNRTLNEILNRTAEPPAEVLKLQFPPQTPYLNVLDRCLRLEEALGMTLISQMNTDLEQVRVLEPLSQKLKFSMVMYAAPLVRAFFLNATAIDMRETYRTLRFDVANLRTPRQDMLEKILVFDSKQHTPLVAALLPAVGACGQAAMRSEAQRRMTYTGLALFRYYHAADESGQPRKKFPQTLGELLPSEIAYLPTDPCTPGQPLMYRLTDDGFLLYSIGGNFKDDGGVQDDENSNLLDLVFMGRAPGVASPPAAPSTDSPEVPSTAPASPPEEAK